MGALSFVQTAPDLHRVNNLLPQKQFEKQCLPHWLGITGDTSGKAEDIATRGFLEQTLRLIFSCFSLSHSLSLSLSLFLLYSCIFPKLSIGHRLVAVTPSNIEFWSSRYRKYARYSSQLKDALLSRQRQKKP